MPSNMTVEIYYDESGEYRNIIPLIREYPSKLHKRWGIQCRFLEASEVDEDAKNVIASDIRVIPPQVRGKIVTRGKRLLPLSKSKRLNLTNTPIILIRGPGEAPLDVYPHMLGTDYVDAPTFLQRLLEKGPNEPFYYKGLLEDPITRIVSEDPSLIEEGMHVVGLDLEAPTGRIDLLLEDKEGSPLLVEVETEASDQAIGQVCRLASGYANMKKVPLEEVRKAIVFRRAPSNLQEAAVAANIELYQISCKRII